MKAIYKAPGEVPQIIDIENTLEALQVAVGGYIETLTFASDACLICNEEGRLREMPYNVDFLGAQIFGPILIVGYEDDKFTDLKRAEEAIPFLFGGFKR